LGILYLKFCMYTVIMHFTSESWKACEKESGVRCECVSFCCTSSVIQWLILCLCVSGCRYNGCSQEDGGGCIGLQLCFILTVLFSVTPPTSPLPFTVLRKRFRHFLFIALQSSECLPQHCAQFPLVSFFELDWTPCRWQHKHPTPPPSTAGDPPF